MRYRSGIEIVEQCLLAPDLAHVLCTAHVRPRKVQCLFLFCLEETCRSLLLCRSVVGGVSWGVVRGVCDIKGRGIVQSFRPVFTDKPRALVSKTPFYIIHFLHRASPLLYGALVPPYRKPKQENIVLKPRLLIARSWSYSANKQQPNLCFKILTQNAGADMLAARVASVH